MSTSMDALLEGVNAEFGGMKGQEPGGPPEVMAYPPPPGPPNYQGDPPNGYQGDPTMPYQADPQGYQGEAMVYQGGAPLETYQGEPPPAYEGHPPIAYHGENAMVYPNQQGDPNGYQGEAYPGAAYNQSQGEPPLPMAMAYPPQAYPGGQYPGSQCAYQGVPEEPPLAMASMRYHNYQQSQQLQVHAYDHNSPAGRAAERAMSRPPDAPLNRCWGAEFKGGDCATCEPGFTCGKVHFKNKFCSYCRAGVDVEAFRIRPLSPELQIAFANSQSEGFWKTGPSHLGGGMLRIVNNTAACVGPWLVIYRDEPPGLQWGELPAKWVHEGYVRLCVAKGTLVPERELRGKSLTRKRDSFAPNMPQPKVARSVDTSALTYQAINLPSSMPGYAAAPGVALVPVLPQLPYCGGGAPAESVSYCGAMPVATAAPTSYCGASPAEDPQVVDVTADTALMAAAAQAAQADPQQPVQVSLPADASGNASIAPAAEAVMSTPCYAAAAYEPSAMESSCYDPNAPPPGGVPPNYGLPNAAYPDPPTSAEPQTAPQAMLPADDAPFNPTAAQEATPTPPATESNGDGGTPSAHGTFTHKFVRAHAELAGLVEARLSAGDLELASSEREMLTAHLRLSSAVLRAVSGAPRGENGGEPGEEGGLEGTAGGGLGDLANVCIGLLRG